MATTYTLAEYADGDAVAAALDLAGTALQLADVGTAAAEDVGAFATAAQGGKADTALQPNAPAQIGGAANYLEILADGTLRLVGGATVFDDITQGIAAARSTGPGYVYGRAPAGDARITLSHWTP